MNKITLTAKIKIIPSEIDQDLMHNAMKAYTNACNFVSKVVFKEKNPKPNNTDIHPLVYLDIRKKFGLKSQMACSVIKTVCARYKSVHKNKHPFTRIIFYNLECDLVYNKDYVIKNGVFEINTLEKSRSKVPFIQTGMEQYFDGSWRFGTAKIVFKFGKFFLHLSMSKDVKEMTPLEETTVVGIDLGINFLATTYDSNGSVTFYNGRAVKNRRAHLSKVRKSLQQRGTKSAKRRLKAIGSRENRWISDFNHCISKALVTEFRAENTHVESVLIASQLPLNTLFAVEDLKGIRNATEKVHHKNRYISVSWAFYQLRFFLEYKAKKVGAKVKAFNPRYTSQECPKCHHIKKANRNKKKHRFCCKSCGYQSNDDRIGAMNLYGKGKKHLRRVISKA